MIWSQDPLVIHVVRMDITRMNLYPQHTHGTLLEDARTLWEPCSTVDEAAFNRHAELLTVSGLACNASPVENCHSIIGDFASSCRNFQIATQSWNLP